MISALQFQRDEHDAGADHAERVPSRTAASHFDMLEK
jgi:hypothetical protein